MGIITATKRSPQIDIPLLERAAVNPNEFAGLFGKQTTWGYRQIYAGKVNVIRELGRLMIPRSEIERLMGTAAPYSGEITRESQKRALRKKASLTVPEGTV